MQSWRSRDVNGEGLTQEKVDSYMHKWQDPAGGPEPPRSSQAIPPAPPPGAAPPGLAGPPPPPPAGATDSRAGRRGTTHNGASAASTDAVPAIEDINPWPNKFTLEYMYTLNDTVAELKNAAERLREHLRRKDVICEKLQVEISTSHVTVAETQNEVAQLKTWQVEQATKIQNLKTKGRQARARA